MVPVDAQIASSQDVARYTVSLTDMLNAVYESLEGRKHWGTNSFRSPVAAADTGARETLAGLFKKLRPIDDGKIVEELENAAKEGLKGNA